MSRFYDALDRANGTQAQPPPPPPSSEAPTARMGTSLSSGPIHSAYERIVQKLLAQSERQRPQVILVVSSVPSEGTSTVARNLAAALGLTGTTRVVLVDANLRTPSQHSAIGVARTKGLTDVVAATMELGSAVKNGFGPGLSVLTSGSPAKSPSQLLSLAAFRQIINDVRSGFHYVILDGPPVTAYADAATLAAVCDGVVLVVKAESTRWEVVEEAKRTLEQLNVPILGAVLNQRQYHIPENVYEHL